jgi:23S rRNA (uracil1939-C5)-methyltransferase
MIEKNDVICAITSGIGSNGEGIIKHEGITFFVPACLPGEKVRFKVLKVKGNIGYGKVEEVLTPAEERVRERCPVFYRCGGCCLQHLEYKAQLAHKATVVKDALRKIGGIQIEVPTAVKSEQSYGYRNKLQLPVGVDKDGNNVIGFYAEHSHRIVPISSCAIHPEWSTKLIAVLKQYMAECVVKGYDEVNKTGSIRHIVAREIGGKFIVTLVTVKESLPNLPYLIGLLSQIFPTFTLYLNINKEDTNVIFGKEFHLVHGTGVFEATEQGIRYEAGPVTFLQVNEGVRSKLYKDALKSVCQDGDEVVIDAYSGGGLLTAMLAKKAKRVYGIELEPEASRCADSLKAKNELDNMINICGYVEEHLSTVMEKEKGEKVRLILDPPRAGIARSVVKALLASGIERITLISCNPATLARDLGILSGRLIEQDGELVKNPAYFEVEGNETLPGYYEIEKIQPYDMFPQTKHVETLVQLSHKKPDTNLEVALDFEDEGVEQSLAELETLVKSRESVRVTYKMIQEYIEEKYGFKVHTAYIAEVKRSLGLPMYDAPNAVEELKKPRQHPTEKMVEAIKDALKYFKII